MEFNQKDIRRAIRDFKMAIENLKCGGYQVYETRVVELINLIAANPILKHIVGPYLDLKVDYDQIFPEQFGRRRFKLPEDKEIQIAYVLQVLSECANGPGQVSSHAANIFLKKKIDENLYLWNEQILFPCLRILMTKLEDLIEDEVIGNEKVEASSLRIINYGTITAKEGNVAIGKDIVQTINKGNGISDEIIKLALEKNAIQPEQVSSVKVITDEIEEELQNDSPSQGKLQELAGKLFDLGKKGLLDAANNVISDPQWGTAVTTYLMGLIS